ncbi:MAG: NADH-quinone oxidoreductase subunit A [Akkermansia sp.]
MQLEYFPALLQAIAGFGFAGMIIVLSVLFGRRAKSREAASIPYECGVVPETDGAPRYFSIKFYLVAILFLIFDLEVIFLYPWAVEFKSLVMHNPEAFASMAAFLGVLFIAYLYAVAKGVIHWHRNPSVDK